MNLYIARDGQTLGPYSDIQAREYLKQGIFDLNDLGCPEGSEQWTALGDLFPNPKNNLAAPATSSILPVERPILTDPRSSASSPHLATVFAVAFLGILSAGVLLMCGWKYFLRDQKPTPLVVASSETSRIPLAGIFKKPGQLNGSIFIVTKGGQSFKLGAVQVGLYTRETLGAFFEAKQQRAMAALNEINPRLKAAETAKDAAENAASEARSHQYDAAYNTPQRADAQKLARRAEQVSDEASTNYWAVHKERAAYLYGWYYFEGMPPAQTVTQTDADGKFTFDVPSTGDYAVVAEAKRSVGDSTELYFWAVKLSMDGSAQKTLMLTNNNLSSAPSKDSLIETAD